MHHSFDINIAEKYGVNETIFLTNVAFWIVKNQANNKNFNDGRHWTYNSSKALNELFPYWSTDQIDRIIKKCVSLGLLLTGNFNETTYDRTRWYSLTDVGHFLFNIPIPQNRGKDSAKELNPFREIAEPIPDIKPNIKPNKERAPEKQRFPLSADFQPNEKTLAYSKAIGAKVGLTADELLIKFHNVIESNPRLSANWNAEYHNFLMREKPFNQPARKSSVVELHSTVRDFVPDQKPKRANIQTVNEHMKNISQFLPALKAKLEKREIAKDLA